MDKFKRKCSNCENSVTLTDGCVCTNCLADECGEIVDQEFVCNQWGYGGKLVYICSPLRGDIGENLVRAQSYCIIALQGGCTPIAPHLMYRDILRDDILEERERALDICLQLVGVCEEIWVFGDKITEGMRREIKEAERLEIEIKRIRPIGAAK